MGFIDDYIEKRSKTDLVFAKAVHQEGFNLAAAKAVKQLRGSLGLTQSAFATLVGQTQSTISRIETGDFDLSVDLLGQIASAAGKRLQIEFV